MVALTYVPIDADAKHGNTQLVKLGDTIAAAWWTGGMWAYRGGHEQLDFEPTHYAVLASADPKGGDGTEIAAPALPSGAVGSEASETPNNDSPPHTSQGDGE
jgi:hypothetical protein